MIQIPSNLSQRLKKTVAHFATASKYSHLAYHKKAHTHTCSHLSSYNWVIITLMAIEMVTLTTTPPSETCTGSKSGSYTLSVQLQQEDPLCSKERRALFEDLKGVTWVLGKCPEGHVRQTSGRKAALEWKSGCCGEDQSHTQSGPFSSVHHWQRARVCVRVWSGVTVCVCLIWFITLRLLANFTHSYTVASTGRQGRHSHTRAQTQTHIRAQI